MLITNSLTYKAPAITAPLQDAMSPRDELLEEFTEARELEREIERAARHGDAAKAFRMVEVEDAILKAARRPMTTGEG